MKKRIYLIAFGLILVLGFLLRFVDLGKVPESLNWDEVSWGYNAYSILKTGHDEHNFLLPMSFEAFGDYKQPVYVYLTSVSIKIFGLNSYAVRFPSAFFGTLTIFFVWLLVFSLFHKEKNRYIISILAMLFFSISPWSIQFSRVAFEANLGIFFVISGASTYLFGLNSGKKYFSLLGILLMSVSCYTYHSNKIFTPLLFIALLVYSKYIYKLPKKIVIIFFAIFLIFNIFWIVDSRTTARGRSVTFISNQTPILKQSVDDITFDKRNHDVGTAFHNRRIVYVNYYLENYLSHFNPNFLFISGDNARHHPFGMGVLYLVSVPVIIAGLLTLKKKYWIVWVWLLLAPVASALAVDAPNASRSMVFLPTWQIFEALGFVSILSIKNVKFRKVLISVLCLLLFVNFFYFTHNYFGHTNNEYGIYWQEGYREVVNEAKIISDSGKDVFISNHFEQPYIFYLFYSKYDPQKYLNSGGSGRTKDGCYRIDNVWFGKCDNNPKKGDYYISFGDENNKECKVVKAIFDKDKRLVGKVNECL